VALLRGIRFLLYNDGYTIRGVQKILREHGPRYVMDFRRIAEEQDRDDAMSEAHEIPDIAAEAAQSGVTPLRRDADRPARPLDIGSLGALLEEIEACREILVAVKE